MFLRRRDRQLGELRLRRGRRGGGRIRSDDASRMTSYLRQAYVLPMACPALGGLPLSLGRTPPTPATGGAPELSGAKSGAGPSGKKCPGSLEQSWPPRIGGSDADDRRRGGIAPKPAAATNRRL